MIDHFVLTMAVRVNTVFDVAVEQLQSQTIKDILSIGSIIADFKPKTNTVDPHTQIFQSTAAGECSAYWTTQSLNKA